MKYDKYIVEIDTKGGLLGGEVFYPLKGLNTYLTAEQLLKLTPLADQCHECCSMERKKTAYEQGLHTAWNAAKKVVLAQNDGGIDYDERKRIFGKGNYSIVKENTVEEVLEKLNELDKPQTITDKDKNCLTCEFSGRPTYKSPCSECNEYSQWEKKLPKSCKVCKSLESGNMLYQLSDWDGGIGFEYIHGIRFCPVCGRKIQ